MDYELKTGPTDSYNQFLAETSLLFDAHLRATNPSKQFRYGQFYYARLLNARPDVANSIMYTELDPYYQHALSSEQHRALEKLWQYGLVAWKDII